MNINLGNVMKGVEVAGNFNPTAKKVSTGYNFVGAIIASVILFLIGIFFLIASPLIGVVILGIGCLIFFSGLSKMKRTKRYFKMRDELMSSLSADEKVSTFFTDIDSNVASENGRKDEKENVMILTDRQIIFLYVPRIGFDDLTGGNILKSVGRAMTYDGLKKKVEKELNETGLRNLVKSSRRAYSMNYSEISEVKVKDFFSKVIFVYRGHKFRYFVRKEQLSEFKQIFKNYIKN